MSAKGGQYKDPCKPPAPICQDQTPKCPPPCQPPIPVCQDQAPVCQDPCKTQDPCKIQDPCKTQDPCQVDPCQTQGKGHGVKK